MRGFDLERWFLRAIDAGHDVELFRTALSVRVLPRSGPRSWWTDRWGLWRTAVFTTVRLRFSAAPVLAESTVAYDPGIASPGFAEHRRVFVRHHFGGTEVDLVGRGELRRPAVGARRGPWLRWYLFGVLLALLALFDWSDRRYSWLGGVLVDMQAYSRLAPSLARVFVFGLYDRRPYVLATFLAKRLHVEVLPVFQNIPLYRNCRFFHLEIPVVLTSRVNIPEAEFYRRQGIFRATELIYRSQEWPSDTKDLAPAAPVYDIGYFSSGEWARTGGLCISDDLDAIRRGDFLGSVYARRSAEILDALAAYARAYGRTLRVYLHPYERRLLGEHGIQPPFARLADGAGVTLDSDPGDSRARMMECRVAVSLQSSFIWERLDLGLSASFIHEFEDPELNPFSRESLGEYTENVYRDVPELLEKIEGALRSSEREADETG